MMVCGICQSSLAGSILHSKDVEPLVKAYHKLAAENGPVAQRAFFEAFPGTWLDFVRAEAFMNDMEGEEFHAYVDAFGRLTAIGDSVYCAKLMNLCMGADLNADGPNFLHRLLHEKMGDVTDNYKPTAQLAPIMLWMLSRVQKGDMISFWNFYWSRIYFEEDGGKGNNYSYDKEFIRLRNMAQKRFPDMLEPMTIAFKYFRHGIIFKTESTYGPRYFGIK